MTATQNSVQVGTFMFSNRLFVIRMFILGAWMAHLRERLPPINAVWLKSSTVVFLVVEFAVGSRLAPSIFLRVLRINNKVPLRGMYHY